MKGENLTSDNDLVSPVVLRSIIQKKLALKVGFPLGMTHHILLKSRSIYPFNKTKIL